MLYIRTHSCAYGMLVHQDTVSTSGMSVDQDPVGTCDGIGLSDGETMECLRSYLRWFGRITKEMRPAHQTDVLTHALVYYGIKTKCKLGKFNRLIC